MIQIPNAVGLILCEKAITEEGTKNVTLVNTFVRLELDEFPTRPLEFVVYALLTDGLGAMPISVALMSLDTLDELMVHSIEVNFTNPNTEYRLRVRVRNTQFPAPGRYQITLFANGEWVAQAALNLVHREE
jgi:hypothetical protein